MSIINNLLNQSIDIYSTLKSVYGDTTRTIKYSNVPCRFVQKSIRIMTQNAEIKEYNAECWVLPDYTIENTYEIVFDSETYKVGSIDKKYDLGGNHDHTKLLLI